MPNRVEDLQPAQSAPVADVQPTSQAEQPTYYWDPLYTNKLRRSVFTEQCDIYRVEIEGSQSCSSDNSRQDVYIERIYEERHPYIAIGRAIIYFMESRCRPRITDVRIYRRTLHVKRTRKRKQ